jgi:hypothetical protein
VERQPRRRPPAGLGDRQPGWNGNRDGDRQPGWNNNRDGNRQPGWNNNRDGFRQPGWNDNRGGYRQNWDGRQNWNGRQSWNGNRESYRGPWRNDWRRDNRYDWRGYRNDHRDLFRGPRYFSPFPNYRYSRLSIGVYLGAPFYAQQFWIADPWAYRLPPAYPPYQWVRYYDDVMLINTYTGEVADVIYDFFW